MPAGPSKQVGSGPVGLRYDIARRCRVAAMLYLGSDFRLLLRTIAEMGSALVDAIRHAPMFVPNSPDTAKTPGELLCAHLASFSQVLLREAPSGVARVAGRSP